MIDGVRIKEVKELVDARGGLVHMVRADESELFDGFGEMYFSITNPGFVKGWHRQSTQTNLLTCIRGRLKLVLFDQRDGSPSNGELLELELGDGARKVVKVPAGVTYGWKTIGDEPSILANCASRAHDPVGATKIDPASGIIPYAW